MVTQVTRQIRIHDDTIKKLDLLKIIPEESYNSIINRLIKEYK